MVIYLAINERSAGDARADADGAQPEPRVAEEQLVGQGENDEAGRVAVSLQST